MRRQGDGVASAGTGGHDPRAMAPRPLTTGTLGLTIDRPGFAGPGAVRHSMHGPLHFLRHFGQDRLRIGSLTPTWRPTARSLASEALRREGPRRILEVGTGTGAVASVLAAGMGPEDRLVLYELYPDFAVFMRKRLETDPVFLAHRGRIELREADIETLDPGERFHCIVSTIPFINRDAGTIGRILDVYQQALEPDGVLSYLEYALLRSLREPFLRPQARAAAAEAAELLARRATPFTFRRDTVLRNLPPAWVHHLRFAAAAPASALGLATLEAHHRLPLPGGWGLATPGLPFVLGPWLLALLLASRWPWAAGLLGLLGLASAAFFRDPERKVQRDPDLAYAAADGRVLGIERLADPRLGPGEWLRIAVFLSVADIHVNRSPVAGRVEGAFDQGRRYAHAGTPAAEENLSRFTRIEGLHGPCVVAQRVGAVARRIVTWVRPGQLLAQGDRFGLIRFGSRTDVYLPSDGWEPLVAPGDRVQGGLTAIARRSGKAG